MVAEKLEEVIEKAVKNKLSNYNNVSSVVDKIFGFAI